MPIQNHIHLSTEIGLAPENSPTVKWKVTEWQPTPVILVDVRRTISGRLAVHSLKTGGQVAQLLDFRYMLKIDDYDGLTFDQRFDLVLSMHGKKAFLVDAIHPEDGSDHTAFVRPVYVKAVSDITKVNPALRPLYITVELMDDSL